MATLCGRADGLPARPDMTFPGAAMPTRNVQLAGEANRQIYEVQPEFTSGRLALLIELPRTRRPHEANHYGVLVL